MKVVQLIDSLASGGAERMAVNFANGIAEQTGFCGLVATRNEGPLKKHISGAVDYLFLDRKNVIDFSSVSRFKKFIKTHHITIIHAHGTSYFFSILVKIIHPSVKIIWHEHLGARAEQTASKNWILIVCSLFFSAVLVVNRQLESWMKRNLLCKNVTFFSNFTVADNQMGQTVLNGTEGKRIVCLANLKHPKNHILLLEAFCLSQLFDQGWTVHFIGKDYNDDYSRRLKNFVIEHKISDFVFFYDQKDDVQYILKQATIGVLCSTAEGFPVTLLEYGLAKLSVLSTNVGYCSELIEDHHNGLLFDPNSVSALHAQLLKLANDDDLRDGNALHLHRLVLDQYSKTSIIQNLISKYNSVIYGN